MEYLDVSPAITEPLCYKQVTEEDMWLVTKYDEYIEDDWGVWPMYAPIEDEL